MSRSGRCSRSTCSSARSSSSLSAARSECERGEAGVGLEQGRLLSLSRNVVLELGPFKGRAWAGYNRKF
jgi:hypothetical protein